MFLIPRENESVKATFIPATESFVTAYQSGKIRTNEGLLQWQPEAQTSFDIKTDFEKFHIQEWTDGASVEKVELPPNLQEGRKVFTDATFFQKPPSRVNIELPPEAVAYKSPDGQVIIFGGNPKAGWGGIDKPVYHSPDGKKYVELGNLFHNREWNSGIHFNVFENPHGENLTFIGLHITTTAINCFLICMGIHLK